MIAWGNERPERVRNSRQLSKLAESEPAGSINGKSLGRSAPHRAEEKVDSRAVIQLTLPRSVLISPLWIR